ncbi:MAG: flavin reductase family protein [Firmicutes bacterium]|jgi:flavin reductase (DIM6/NTAB) family NADH-FMN oxidoreductase RutF|nr:flavin reductase family protein [Bacillota bacterium]
MSKIKAELNNYLYPIPAVPVSCTDGEGHHNIITLAWTGVACGVPPMISIAVNLARYSHNIIKSTKMFCINIPDTEMLYATDYCGNVSGRDVNKFKELSLTPVKGDETGCYYIDECPINIECIVRHTIALGSHELFIGEVVGVYVRDGILTPEGRISTDDINMFAYIGPGYYSIGEKIGQYGYSVKGRSLKT